MSSITTSSCVSRGNGWSSFWLRRSRGDHLEEAYPDYPWHEPIGMRNLIAHEYWRSDPELIWTALAEDVREVERMVRDFT